MSASPSPPTFLHYFRSFVLLAALVVLPLLATFWQSLPSGMKEFGSYVQAGVKNWFLTPEAPEPNYRHSSAAVRTESVDDHFQAVDKTPSLLTEYASVASPSRFEAVQNQGINQSIYQNNDQDIYMSTRFGDAAPPIEQRPGFADTSVMPAFAESPPVTVPYASQATYIADAAVTTPQNRYAPFQAELDQLGATYYSLERWGSQEEYFKCTCFVLQSGANNASALRHFQHIDADDLRAMQSVIAQVRTWRNESVGRTATMPMR